MIWKECGRKWLWGNLRHFVGICLKGLRRTLVRIVKVPDWNLNVRPPTCAARGLPTLLPYLVFHCCTSPCEVWLLNNEMSCTSPDYDHIDPHSKYILVSYLPSVAWQTILCYDHTVSNNMLLASSYLSICLHGATWFPLDGLSWHLGFGYLFKICQENSSFIKMW
jgi:hypothetical protein